MDSDEDRRTSARSRRRRPLRAAKEDRTRAAADRPSRFEIVDAAIHRALVSRSLLLLRLALGVIFLFFGALKLVPGQSPAESLVMETIERMTFDLVPGRVGLAATGAIECVLGLLLLTGWLRRLTIYLLGLELLGVLAPLALLSGRLFDGPAAPTIEGQYVLKDIILVAAGMVLATTIRGGRLVTGPHSAQPTARPEDADAVSADEKLRMVIESIRAGHSTTDAARVHGITPKEFERWRDELLDGAVENMTSPPKRSM